MKITDVRSTIIRVPFLEVVRDKWPEGYQTIIVEVETDEGVVGIGESGMWLEPEIQLQILDEAKRGVLGEDPFDMERIRSKLWGPASVHRRYWPINRSLSGIETAIWDVMGKACGKPLCKLLGGMFRNKVPFMPCLYRYPEVETRVKEAEDKVERGFKCFHIKVGEDGGTPEEDLAVVKAVREAVGSDVALVIDANSGWSTGTAIRMIRKMERDDLLYVEDPVSSLDEMAVIRKRVEVPICAHVFAAGSEQEALDVIKKEAADVMVVAHRNVGICGVKKAAAVAEAASIPVVLHSGFELGPALSVMVHLAASTPNCIYPNQLQYDLISDDIIKGGRLEFVDGCLEVPEKPGIGVELDPEKMSRYAEDWREFRRRYPLSDDPHGPREVRWMPFW